MVMLNLYKVKLVTNSRRVRQRYADRYANVFAAAPLYKSGAAEFFFAADVSKKWYYRHELQKRAE